MSFREFLLKQVEDDVSPEQAQQRYEEYLVQYYGDELKAMFQQKKGDPA